MDLTQHNRVRDLLKFF
jgi:hypothetical protein